MKPKEKAKELVNKYLQVYDGRVTQAKQCALICVDEMKKASHKITQHLPSSWIGKEQEYYDKVKQEIEKL